MARIRREGPDGAQTLWRVGLYTRLSREDGDKPESDSIANQKALLEDFIAQRPALQFAALYTDDGFTGTNFQRPDFQRMLADIEGGRINCVLVKDLSRFGRDYIDVGRYLERVFPEQGVRFLAINDNIDSEKGPYDMLLPVKNVFNEQYARDISKKVKSAFQAKQRQGAFIGAFASYGYRKEDGNHNKLVVDPCAAQTVKRIFDLFEGGMGKVKIAKQLNGEGIPCPSEYKRLSGERYTNGRRMQSTTYWTYATIHRMLQNQMYAGNMEQGRASRQTLHGKARQLGRDQWTVVADTHEAIIQPEQWARVQALLERDTRSLSFAQNVSPFAGFLRCGDCGRAMSKTNHSGGIYYCCGSYKRYGPTVCAKHNISHAVLEQIVLGDLNQMISSVKNLKALAEQARPPTHHRNLGNERERLKGSLTRVYRLKKSAYEDFRENLVSREDYVRYKEDYEHQERQVAAQLEQLSQTEEEPFLTQPWVEALLKHGRLTELDRITVAETLTQILIFEDHLEITYTFSDELGVLG